MATYHPPPSSLPPQGRPFGLRFSPLAHHAHNYTPLTPVSFLLRAALIHPTKLALSHPERRWALSYSQWAARCLSLSFALRRALPGGEWKKGDRIAVVTPNAPLILDLYQAVPAVGGVVVPINIRNTKQEVAYVLQHSGARAVFVDSELQSLVDASDLPPDTALIVSHDSGGQDPADPYEAFLARGRRAWDEAQAAEFAQYGPDAALRDWELLPTPEEDDVMALCYTSGTTGRPKGVCTTHRGCYLAAVANAHEASIGYESVYLWVLPIFHATGWTFPWSCTMGFATQQILRRVDPAQIWAALRDDGVTHYTGAPTVQISIVNHPSAVRLPREVKVAVAASAPTAHLLGKMESLNLKPVHVYGATETHGPLTRRYAHPDWEGLDLDARARLMARQGHGFVTAEEARVVRLDPEGPHGGVLVQHGRLVDVRRDGAEIGEIALRGNIVMQGYYADDAATAKTVRQGWFLTGDLAVRHPGGEVEIKDRGKDIIISGGENVSSLAVEQELASHPAVLESCVVARPHEKWGERGHAFVVLKGDAGEGKVTPEELKQYCRKRMSGFAVPEWIEFVKELPKTSTGKVQKNVLRGRVAKL